MTPTSSPKMSGQVFFRETQRLRKWWLLLILAIPVVLIWWAVVQQILFDQPFGDNPAPDFVLVILVIIVGVGLPLVILNLRLVTEVLPACSLSDYAPFIAAKFTSQK